MKYPFAIAEPVTYFSVVLEEEYLLFADALYWACCDTLFAQLTTHISLQFQVEPKHNENYNLILGSTIAFIDITTGRGKFD